MVNVSLPTGAAIWPLHTVVQFTTTGVPVEPPLGAITIEADFVEADT